MGRLDLVATDTERLHVVVEVSAIAGEWDDVVDHDVVGVVP